MEKFEVNKFNAPDIDILDKLETEKTYLRFIEEMKGRKEYIEGEIPLDFKNELSDGSMLRAKQDESGIANIFIEKNGEIVFNFKELLPKEYEYVTPKYINSYNKN